MHSSPLGWGTSWTPKKLLVCLVYLVSLMQPNKPDKPNRPNEQDRLAVFFYTLLQYKANYADIHTVTSIDLPTEF